MCSFDSEMLIINIFDVAEDLVVGKEEEEEEEKEEEEEEATS